MEKYCKSCGRVFKDSDFKICPYCGNQLSTRTGRQPIPRKLRHQVFQRDGYRCRECGATNKQTRLHVDHIKPVAKGGTNDLSNLQTLCEACNRAKYTDEWIGGDEHNVKNNSNDAPYNTKRCPFCNSILHLKANVCVKCGNIIEDKEYSSSNDFTSEDDELIDLKNLNDTFNRIVREFIACNNINTVSKEVDISASKIKHWYNLGKRQILPYKNFYDNLSDLSPNMSIKDSNTSETNQINYSYSSRPKYKTCPKCGKSIGEVTPTCPYCGNREW